MTIVSIYIYIYNKIWTHLFILKCMPFHLHAITHDIPPSRIQQLTKYSWGAQWGIGGGCVIDLQICMWIEEKKVTVQYVGQKWTL